MSVLVVGAGAIGLSITGWVAPKHNKFFVLARGETAKTLKNQGFKFYLKDAEASAVPMLLKTVESLNELPTPDIIVLAVKNYDLDSTAAQLRGQLGSKQPIVVALQNGVENQRVLPRYFSRVIYGVVCFNAWRDAPGMIGHQKNGYLILGTPKNDLQAEQQQVAAIMRLGLNCVVTDRLEDAVHCKLAVNLTNALTALVSGQDQPNASLEALTHLSAKLIWEGIQVIKANGYYEHKLGSIPSWRVLRISAALPSWIVAVLYRFTIREDLGFNSTAQDLLAGKSTTELEYLNGYMLNLAQKAGLSMPINQVVYQLAKERFGPEFKPMTKSELLNAIKKNLKK